MEPSTDLTEFEICADSAGPIEPKLLGSADERVLGCRTASEWYYRKWKERDQQADGKREKEAHTEEEMLLHMIDVADSFEDVFRMCRQKWYLRLQKGAIRNFTTTYEMLKHKLAEDYGVHQVEIEGKGYQDVKLGDAKVPEPWEVVGAVEGKGKSDQKVVRAVVRSLWVRVAKGKPTVLRRAKVMY